MSRQVVISVVAALVLIASGAELNAASLSLGFRYWSSSWTIDNQMMENPPDTAGPSGYTTPSFLDPIDSIDVSGIGMFGGSLSLAFTKKISLTATFMTGNFDFNIKNTAHWDFPAGSTYKYYESYFLIKQSAQRFDYDLAFQYKFTSYITAFIGYKKLEYSFDQQTVNRTSHWVLPSGGGPSLPSTTVIPAYSVGYQGPGMGVNGYYPIPSTSFIYYGTLGFLPYLSTTGDFKARLGSNSNGWAANAELGIGYASPTIPLIPTLGYKYQIFAGFGDMKEVFHGVTVGLSYNFNF